MEKRWVSKRMKMMVVVVRQGGKVNKIEKARNIIRKAFERDKHFKYGYVANIAMLLHDRYGITDYDKRNSAALDILQLVFYS